MAALLKLSLLLLYVVQKFSAVSAQLKQHHQEQHKKSFHGLVPAMFFFGDSVVDVGNNNFITTVARANFLPYGRDWSLGPTGRFSNGHIAIDFIGTTSSMHNFTLCLNKSFIAEGFGISYPPAYLDPNADLTLGINFGSSASGYLNSTRRLLNVAPLYKQLDWYTDYLDKLQSTVGEAKATTLISESLFILSTGTNDLLDYYINPALRLFLSRQGYFTMMLDQLMNFIQVLYRSGARKIAFTSLPPVGCLPAQVTFFGSMGSSGCVSFQNEDAVEFNLLLVEAFKMLSSLYHDLKLGYLDIYTVIKEAAEVPAKFGFEYGTRGCCGTGRFEASLLCNELILGTCKNASQFVFWDAYHPSDAMNKIIADRLFKEGFSQMFFHEVARL